MWGLAPGPLRGSKPLQFIWGRIPDKHHLDPGGWALHLVKHDETQVGVRKTDELERTTPAIPGVPDLHRVPSNNS